MPNQRNTKFPFGFLNNNQDAVDLKTPEATECFGLDPDRLALGTLEAGSFITGSEGSKDFGVDPGFVSVAGTEFMIIPGTAPRENEVYWKDEDDIFTSFGDTNVKEPAPVISLEEAVAVVIESDTTPGANTATTVPSVEYIGVDSNQITITIISDAGGAGASMDFSLSALIGFPNTATPNTKGTAFNITIDGSNGKGIQFTFDNTVDYTVGQVIIISINVTALPDGPYSYATSLHRYKKAQNKTEVRSPLGESITVTLRNFNDVGARISSFTPAIAHASDGDGLLEVYRSDDSTDGDFVRVLEDQSAIVGTQPDVALVSGLNPLIVATKNLDDEAELSEALGNTDGANDFSFAKLFSFDSILWRVPTYRPDLLIFQDPGKILDWSRANNFSFDGSIIDVIEVRDPTTVGGTLTKVVLTSNGIYNITGSGSDADPYISARIITGIDCVANSVVNANGIVMFMSKSSDAGYDTGAYGQKIYEYDLQKVTEISQRVRNSSILTNTAALDFAELRGGDKYLIKATNTVFMVYHRDAKGWVESTTAIDGSSWTWASKNFTPPIMERFKIQYARKIKIDYIGKLLMQFINISPADSAETITQFELPNTSSRATYVLRMPKGLGQKWRFRVSQAGGSSPDLIIYDWYFVK